MESDKNSLRKNDMIIAAAKGLTHPKHTQKYIPILSEIIESVFNIAAINNKKNLLLWSIGSGVFKNDPIIVASLFVDAIKKKTRNIVVFYRNNYGDLWSTKNR